MGLADPRLPYVGLKRPRLLPATIVAMSALLAIKAVIMVQAVAGEAIAPAQADTAPVLPGMSPPALKNRPAGSAPSPAGASLPNPPIETSASPVSEPERAILLALRRRRAALDDRAHDLDAREGDINAADHRLEDRVQQLSKLQAKLEALESSRQKHADENWTGLVKVYEAMKPREAASIFDSLDMQVLLQVIDRMQDRRAAPVLAAMQPDRARLVTQMLAEMRTRSTIPREVHD